MCVNLNNTLLSCKDRLLFLLCWGASSGSSGNCSNLAQSLYDFFSLTCRLSSDYHNCCVHRKQSLDNFTSVELFSSPGTRNSTENTWRRISKENHMLSLDPDVLSISMIYLRWLWISHFYVPLVLLYPCQRLLTHWNSAIECSSFLTHAVLPIANSVTLVKTQLKHGENILCTAPLHSQAPVSQRLQLCAPGLSNQTSQKNYFPPHYESNCSNTLLVWESLKQNRIFSLSLFDVNAGACRQMIHFIPYHLCCSVLIFAFVIFLFFFAYFICILMREFTKKMCFLLGSM